MAKLTQEELNKLLEEAPKNAKGQPVIPDDVFMDNLANLPEGTRSEDGKYANDKGYLSPGKKGDPKTIENCSKAGKAAQAIYAERKKFAESIDIFLKTTDADGVSNQDKIVMALGEKAMDGCVGAFEALRDTVGEKPSDQVSLDVMTDGDKQLMEILKKRLGYDGPGSVTKQ